MPQNDNVRSEVLRAMRTIEQLVQTIDMDKSLLGAALVETGLRVVANDGTRPVSPAEKKLIRKHHPTATDEGIAEHRVTPEVLSYILDLLTTAARKYLDHQPEACAVLEACPDDRVVNELVAVVTRNQRNAYGSAGALGVSSYDVAAATITNASILASENGVGLEQLAIIHLEGIQRALEYGRVGRTT